MAGISSGKRHIKKLCGGDLKKASKIKRFYQGKRYFFTASTIFEKYGILLAIFIKRRVNLLPQIQK